MPFKPPRLVTVLFFCFIANLIAGCLISSELNDRSGQRKNLIVALGTDASTLDPHRCTDSATEVINKNIYNNLVRFDSKLKIIPDLATEWKQADDGVTWTFKLRKNVVFHDGTNFDAEAVKYNINRILDYKTGSSRRSVLDIIKSVEVADAYAVKIVTRYPRESFLYQLAHPVAGMVSPTAAEKYGVEKLGLNPVGTGAFKFVKWLPDEKLEFAAFDKYYEGVPKVSSLTFKIVPEDSSRVMLLESGQVDVAVRLPVNDVARLKRNQNIAMTTTPTIMTMYIALNNQKAPFNDPQVRLALNHAVNRNALVNELVSGSAVVADSVVPPGVRGYSNIGAYAYDPHMAKQLLNQAGYPDGFEFTLWTTEGRYLMDKQVAKAIQAQMQAVGVQMNIRTWEFQALMSEVKKGQFDAVLLGWSASTADADQALYPVFESSQFPPMANRAFYKNNEVDELLSNAKTEPDQLKRDEIYKQVQQIVMDDAPWIPLFYPIQTVAYRANISDIEVLPTEHMLFSRIRKH